MAEIEPVGEPVNVYEWECDEHPHRERGRVWHVAAAVIGVLLLIYAVATDNFLFAFLVIIFSVLIYMRSLGKPDRIICAVSPAGISVGPTGYRLKDLRKYWFAYEPPLVKRLYVEVESFFPTRLAIELDDADPNEIRAILGRYVREDHEEDGEPISDLFARMFKL